MPISPVHHQELKSKIEDLLDTYLTEAYDGPNGIDFDSFERDMGDMLTKVIQDKQEHAKTMMIEEIKRILPIMGYEEICKIYNEHC